MPIPENPQSRSEQYLNAIATGDNSGLPEFPQSRMEQYLEVIAQNGGGGSSGGGVLVVEYIQGDENDYIDATAKELMDAIEEGKLVFLKHNEGGSGAPVNVYDMRFISNATKMTLTGVVSFTSISAYSKEDVHATVWVAATENDKPIADYGE